MAAELHSRARLSNDFWDVEHEKSGVYDAEKAKRIDRMLDLCRKYGIRVKLTMEHFRSIGGGRQAWADKPLHNVANGGTAAIHGRFLRWRASREQFKRKDRLVRKALRQPARWSTVGSCGTRSTP